MQGIYMIVDLQTSKRYLGCSKDIGTRFSHHRSLLKNRSHYNLDLQQIWDDRQDQVAFVLIEECNREILFERESFYRKSFGELLLNRPYIGSRGREVSVETRERISRSKLGKKLSKSRVGQGLGRKFSEETRQRMSQSAKNRRTS